MTSVVAKTVDVPRICIVIPYFGKWPFWFPFFVESCRRNPTIDWIIYTDCGVPERCPPNVRVCQMSYPAYCDLVSARLGIDFHPANPYKLCDIKPALGYLHASDLHGYAFWGFGDIDLIYGDLRAYFTAERLRDRWLLSTHARRVSGHLCLIKNDDSMQRCFMTVPDWRQRLADPAHCAFDEGPFSRLFVRHKNLPEHLAKRLRWFNTLWRKSEFAEAYSTPHGKIAWVDGSAHFPARWYWNEGVLRNDRDGARTFPYFHFMVWKQCAWKELVTDGVEIDMMVRAGAWEISASGFSPALESLACAEDDWNE